jgi:hypothetical protein
MKCTAAIAVALLACLALLWWHEMRSFGVRQRRDAMAVIERFHEHFNDRDFDKICEEAFGCAGSERVRSGWNSVLQEVADRAGKFRGVKSSDIKAYIEPFSVRADYVCSFEKTDVKEIFILKRFDEGHLRILSYQTVTNALRVPSQ